MGDANFMSSLRVLNPKMKRRRRWLHLKKKAKSPFQCGSTGGGVEKNHNGIILSHLRGEQECNKDFGQMKN
jgi:hypothetical protein